MCGERVSERERVWGKRVRESERVCGERESERERECVERVVVMCVLSPTLSSIAGGWVERS